MSDPKRYYKVRPVYDVAGSWLFAESVDKMKDRS